MLFFAKPVADDGVAAGSSTLLSTRCRENIAVPALIASFTRNFTHLETAPTNRRTLAPSIKIDTILLGNFLSGKDETSRSEMRTKG
jgi:hypothetical protein